jgi:hypothetical protein
MQFNKWDQERSNHAEFNGRGTMMNGIEQTQWVIVNFDADLAPDKQRNRNL